MSATGTQFKNKIIGVNPSYVAGQLQMVDNNQATPNKLRSGATFAVSTGGANGYISDVLFGQAANITLIPDSDIPLNMRCYVTRCDIDVQGAISWTGGRYVMLCDSNGAPLVYLPTASLSGLSSYTFPDSDLELPIESLCTAYNTSTGVITLTGSPLVSAAYSLNCVATIVSGTGIGQSLIISSNTASAITPLNGAAALPIAPDTTSLFAIWYWAATATPSTTTVPFSNAAFGVNALDNGYNLVGVTGTSAGKPRPIASNTSTTPTVAYAFNTAPSIGDLMMVSNNPPMFGALDLTCADKWSASGVNRGLQIQLGGTFTAGSPIRVYVEGFFAP